jgi:hypothetical protein
MVGLLAAFWTFLDQDKQNYIYEKEKEVENEDGLVVFFKKSKLKE